MGVAVVYDNAGGVYTFAGDATKLYKLNAAFGWDDVTRTSGGAYSVGGSERWQFGFAGGLVLACTIGEDPQKFLLGSSTNFEPLGGTPPKARYVAVVRDFVVLGGLDNDELTVHWSGIANPEHWALDGTQQSDIQTFQNGGPVRGLIGGEVGYVLQAEKITRMTYVPGSQYIFQFDEVEGGRGLAAPYSLVRVGSIAYYLAPDGFYAFALAGGTSTPLGVGKWAAEFSNDIKPGSELTVIGAADPVRRVIMWAYNSADNSSTSLNRILVYDWTLDEAVRIDATVTAMAQILSQGVTLDGLDAFGTMDSLPFSLDSPVWRGGGASGLALFSTDRKMSQFSGPNMAATLVTNDAEQGVRMLVTSVRAHVDTRNVTAEIACRESEGDTPIYGPANGVEDTGWIPAWSSGWLARARIAIGSGAVWSQLTGIDTLVGKMGQR